jgi:hypothetical protein
VCGTDVRRKKKKKKADDAAEVDDKKRRYNPPPDKPSTDLDDKYTGQPEWLSEGLALHPYQGSMLQNSISAEKLGHIIRTNLHQNIIEDNNLIFEDILQPRRYYLQT